MHQELLSKNKLFSHFELLDYSELYNIISKKHNATHDELKYWIYLSLNYAERLDEEENQIYNEGQFYLIPFESDIPNEQDHYLLPKKDFFNPQYYFYIKRDVHEFMPAWEMRIVYFKDLPNKRNWSDFYPSEIDKNKSNLLVEASKSGLLRCYDRDLNEFTYYKNFRSGEKESKRPWAQTEEGLEILRDPDSFFLLEDIIKIERAILKKDRDLCLQELNIHIEKPSPKIISFEKKKKEVLFKNEIIVIDAIPESLLGMAQRILSDTPHKQYNQRSQNSSGDDVYISIIEVVASQLPSEQLKELKLHFKCITQG